MGMIKLMQIVTQYLDKIVYFLYQVVQLPKITKKKALGNAIEHKRYKIPHCRVAFAVTSNQIVLASCFLNGLLFFNVQFFHHQ